ncbi:hypothetical protein Taro_048506 [Colocasia esculenta]|uniref:Uncharacterized protein n=1 Tax=Colocasia esculenta TaxID=4460 RepID=A0A843X8A9_COLES|nr:hypothetical protein [Colocasia esculenta]
MRGTINVITRIARSMNERLDAVAEVLEPREVMGLGVLCQDMKIIHNHPNNNKEAKRKHNSNMGDMKANKGKQGMIEDMGLHIHPFLVPQNCHIQISTIVVGLVIWAIFKLLDMVVSSLRDTQEKVQVNKQQHREASKEDSKTLQILCLALDIHTAIVVFFQRGGFPRGGIPNPVPPLSTALPLSPSVRWPPFSPPLCRIKTAANRPLNKYV